VRPILKYSVWQTRKLRPTGCVNIPALGDIFCQDERERCIDEPAPGGGRGDTAKNWSREQAHGWRCRRFLPPINGVARRIRSYLVHSLAANVTEDTTVINLERQYLVIETIRVHVLINILEENLSHNGHPDCFDHTSTDALD